eukprot:2233658-Amphidinium_carterae.2
MMLLCLVSATIFYCASGPRHNELFSPNRSLQPEQIGRELQKEGQRTVHWSRYPEERSEAAAGCAPTAVTSERSEVALEALRVPEVRLTAVRMTAVIMTEERMTE